MAYVEVRGLRKAYVTRRGRTGTVKMKVTKPLSIGGKLTNGGKIPLAGNDQFSGVVDEVVYAVGD